MSASTTQASAPPQPALEIVQIENDQEYYQGEVLPSTNIKHGEGTLLDKIQMTQYTGTFENNIKRGETCQLVSLDDDSEIVEYTGGFENDKFHGMGILLLRNGFLYKGDFLDGLPSEGIMRYPNGEEYTGPLSKDKLRDGYGIMKYTNGDQYCGDFVADQRSGKGIFKKIGGDTINGVWKEDILIMGQQRYPDGVYFGSFDEKMLPSGKGIFQYDAAGDIYQGNWKDGLQDGWGTFKDENSTYVGVWKKGQKVEGTLKYEESGEVFVGTFVDGEKECGVITYKNGDEFSGEFKNSKRFMGVMSFKDSKEVYKGEFNEQGQFHGSGKHITDDGDQYSGHFQDGRKHGQGELILAENGGTYIGDFDQDEMHGNGCFKMPDGGEYWRVQEWSTTWGRYAYHIQWN